MRRLLQKLLSVVGPSLIGALGFTSCDFPFIPRTEYGSPNCDFKVDITVLDEAGTPLKGIKVTPVLIPGRKQDGSEIREELHTVATDENGKASDKINIFGITHPIRVVFEDADGDLNGGSFAKDSMDFTPVQTKQGDNHWNSGEYTISGTKKMKKE